MDKLDFINKIIGVEWKHRRYDFDGVDCHGLVILYFKEVLGIDIGIPPGYHQGEDMATCWQSDVALGKWREVDRPVDGHIVFTCYDGDRPAHVGIMIDRVRAMHCRGTRDYPGHVEIHKIRAIEKTLGRVTYHKYLGIK